jgi:hypothetical protein
MKVRAGMWRGGWPIYTKFASRILQSVDDDGSERAEGAGGVGPLYALVHMRIAPDRTSSEH